MTALVLVEAVVIGLLVLLVAGLLRSHADVLRRLHALDGGAEGRPGAAPVTRATSASGETPEAVVGDTPDGGTSSIALRGDGTTLLAFLSSGCSTCRPFWEAFATEATMPAPDVRPVIVTKGVTEESPGAVAALAPRTVPTVMSSAAWEAFGIQVSPYFVLVDGRSGTVVGEGAAATWGHVSRLLAQALADAGHAGGDARGRRRRDDDGLEAAPIEPGDPSLYRNPHGPGA